MPRSADRCGTRDQKRLRENKQFWLESRDKAARAETILFSASLPSLRARNGHGAPVVFDKDGAHEFRKFERRRNLVRKTFRELAWVETLEYDGRADIAEAEFICNTTSLSLVRPCTSQGALNAGTS